MRHSLLLARIALLAALAACAAAEEPEPPSKRGMTEKALPGGPMHNPDVVNPGGAGAVTPNGVATPQPGNPAGAPAVSEPSGHHLPVQPAQPAPLPR